MPQVPNSDASHTTLSNMSGATNQYIRNVLHQVDPPPAVAARFFYASNTPIDDPLSPLPPPATGNVSAKQPSKPFSEADNVAIDQAWNKLRLQIRKYNEEHGEKSRNDGSKAKLRSSSTRRDKCGSRSGSASATPRSIPTRPKSSSPSRGGVAPADLEMSLETASAAMLEPEASSLPDTTGTPFIRAPSRAKVQALQKEEKLARPKISSRQDTYEWDDPSHLAEHTPVSESRDEVEDCTPSAKVPVGVSKLHQVELPDLQMTPIYWTPVHDTAPVIRGTWFYKDTMLPVETAVANMLEAGYVDLQVWTETWRDELNSAVEVGAAGEMKILHKLWPDKPQKRPTSRPRTRSTISTEDLLQTATSALAEGTESPEQLREKAVEAACDIIDIATGPNGADNKALGIPTYGWQGAVRTFASFGVIYANEKEARLLKPSLMPSEYYGRRPLANYIRKGYKLGISVVRGFDQAVWDKLHHSKTSSRAKKAEVGASTSVSGMPATISSPPGPYSALTESPQVTDLVLIIHGIGQKYASRYESFHFTHAINSFRREINVELGSREIRARLRKDIGGIMALPINWRHSLSFDEGGFRDDDPTVNEFSLDDITPETLPSVRNIVSDVMLDIPYYMSHHQPKMIAAVTREANRVYQLWCKNNPGFAENGRVHLIAHSLGSVMAIDILSRQPTNIPQHLADPNSVHLDTDQVDYFLFNTSNLFLAGSPVGFFLLLKKSQLLPRMDYSPTVAENDPDSNNSLICGEQGQYGCIAVENVYNIINPYDPVAYRMNAAVDSAYSASLKQAVIPSATPGWFGVGTKSSTLFGPAASSTAKQPGLPRLPSNVELEIHNFTREEIAEERMYLLNDNGQIDFFLRYGGGAFEIQYLTMLSAHSSYWLLKDFVRMVVTEVGRERGREGTFLGMRAVKRKKQAT